MRRLVCSCGTPIPAHRAGRECCSPECDAVEAQRQRDAEWQAVLDDEAVRVSQWVERQMAKVHAALAAMARGLGERPWCNGGHFSLADIAVGCALGWLEFRYPDIDWRTSHPNLGRLLDKLAQRPSFADTVPVAG